MPQGNGDLCVVTGAFGYTGRYIARRLIADGKRVRTLTNHPNRDNPFGDSVESAPLAFSRPDVLVKSLQGADVLFNTYWIRFEYGGATFEKAVANTEALVRAAEEAGVRRVVHVSVSNPSEDSPLPYFRGKALAEKAVAASKLSYAIIRPTLIFAAGDILINNIAWLLRKFRLFPIPGRGDFRLQPISAEDVADLAVAMSELDDNAVVNAFGPEVYTFDDLVRKIDQRIGARARILHVSPALALALSNVVGYFTGDVILTRDEVEGLSANLLVCPGEPTGKKRLSDWLMENSETIGRAYASELARHYE